MKQLLKSVLKALGLLEFAKAAYYRRKKTAREVLGIRRRFWTTSPSLYRRVVKSGGEQYQLERFLQNVKAGDTVWDVGSYVGIYSIFSSHPAGRDGAVYAFEPEPAAHALLNGNIALNGIGNVKPMRMALSDSNGKGRIYSALTDAVAIHSLRHYASLSESGFEIDLATGDSLVQEGRVPPPDVVKVDVEGADYHVLKGMRSALSRPECRFLLIEVHPKLLPGFGASERDVRQAIREAGFTVDEELQRGDEIHLICSKHPGQ
ncbi:FkbM family methyltransferase [bacterium]|nr:FkbM family methyltransferase [bacterium]